MSQFAFAGIGALLNVFGASAANKRAKAAAARARASTIIQGSRQSNANARQTQRIVGDTSASFGERNVFGKSSKAILLDRFSRGSENEMDIRLNTYFKLVNIDTQLSQSKQSLGAAAFSGAISGFQFGQSFGDAFGGGGSSNPSAGPPAGTGPNFLGAPGQGGFI